MSGLQADGERDGVNPHSVHRVCQKIRNQRNELNADEKWARTIEHRDTRSRILDEVFFWRKVMDYAERLVVNKESALQ